MTEIPKDKLPDSSLSLLGDGYEFISKRCERLQSDVFRTRLMLKPAVCMRGYEAARLFYDQTRFQRQGATPGLLRNVLFGRGGVQGLDNEAHVRRKAMFMSMMTEESVENLAKRFENNWLKSLSKWTRQKRVVLFDESHEILTRAVCSWAEVPLQPEEVEERTRQFARMIDDSGSVGPGHFRGRLARKRAEKWIGKIIRDVRSGRLKPSENCALDAVAHYRGPEGGTLDTQTAAVELINFLRPTVAIGRYIVFAALALNQHPEWRTRVAGNDADLENFVQEVRRISPFFPFVAAITRYDFTWRDYDFPADTRTLLDLYGTNRDPGIWREPDKFDPERFKGREVDAFSLIPQGGGDHHHNHRCAGEWITIELMKKAVRLMTAAMDYEVPKQDLSVSLSRMPAIPKSRFVMSSVKQR